MKVMITGVNGFLGERLALDLKNSGYSIYTTGRQQEAKNPALQNNYLKADLCNMHDANVISKGMDTIIHCAGKAGAWGDKKGYVEANIRATQNLLVAARNSGSKRFINFSTPSIYFQYKDQLGLKEQDIPVNMLGHYAATKLQAERLVSKAHSKELWTLSFRPRGIIGAGDRNWLPRIIDLCKKNRLIQVGHGKNLADFTSVSNISDAVILALKAKESAWGESYNLTNGDPKPLWEVIDEALEVLGISRAPKKFPKNIMMGLAEASSMFHRIKGTKKEPAILPIKIGVAAYSLTLDISKAQSKLGYQPMTSTTESIREFSEWWKSNH